MRLPVEKRYMSRVRNTAATNRFYSIDGHPDGTDAFEKARSLLEGNAASALRAIEEGAWLLSEEGSPDARDPHGGAMPSWLQPSSHPRMPGRANDPSGVSIHRVGQH